nr:immunoglobulin light chain junction region [Macaca mulatta]
WQQGSSYPWTL